MKTGIKAIAALVCLVALAFALGGAREGAALPAAAATATPEVTSVFVVNPRENPVPVRVGGITSITGTVNISSQENTVRLDPASSSVQLSSSLEAPIWTSRADEPARNPFQQAVNLTIDEGQRGVNVLLSIPAGKRLVIGYVSGLMNVPPGQVVGYFALTGELDSKKTSHYLVVAPTVGGGFILSQPVEMYVDPPSLTISAVRNETQATASGTLTVSGHLTDLP